LRSLQGFEPPAQFRDLPAQLGDLAALVDQLCGEAAQGGAELPGAKLGFGS
jgi:hypothetical protein